MPTNEQIIKAAGVTTGDVTYGLLNSEQARTFIKQTFEATPLGALVRHEMRKAKLTKSALRPVSSARRPRTSTQRATGPFPLSTPLPAR